jgi:DNA-binding CsgD family transcriptional regulator
MNLAQESLEKSLQIMEKQNNYPLLLNIHRQSANFYRERGNFEKAYYHMNRLQEVQAVLDENEQDNEVNRLYYSVLLDLEKEKAKTIMLRNENLEKQSDIFILLIVVSVFSLLVISMLFYFFSNRFRNRILRIEEQKESLLAARLRLSKELSARNKEIAAVVLNQVMHNEQSLDVIQKLRKIGEQSSKEIQKELYELASLLASSQNKNIWNEFEKYFKQLNPEFFSRLTSKHENLTSRDLRYSALISLQISSKEMSLITGMTLQSIHVLRSRLRNKLGLDKDADLAVYLSSFSSEE